ncbi:glycosyltransferase [Actinophytocola sp.]|uniref:glycosyltransferase family 2 protein n=1 Tax=Actinophytocola sp. TaxID=1872138 RepID=UPI002ED871F7
MNPRLSVIIPTKNRQDTLRRALTSVVAQGRADVEVVVVNDGGAPVDPVLDEFRDRLAVRHLAFQEPVGTSAARNHAIEVAEGEFLGLLDDDDLYLPGHLDAAVDTLTGGAVDAVYATVGVSKHWIDPNVTEPPDLPHAFDYGFHDGFLSVLNYIPTTAVVVRADRTEPLRFDPALRVGEDWDLWLRLARGHGYRFGHLDRVGVVYHRIPAHSVSADPVGDGRRALSMFHDGYLLMCKRWVVPGESAEAAYRDLVLRVYELAFERYDSGRTLGAYWYERMVRTLHDGFVAGEPAAALLSVLPTVLEER